MVKPLDRRLLSDRDAARLYERFPELRPSPDNYCPTCHKKGTYQWKGATVTCDCRQQLQFHKHYLNAGIGILYQRQSWDDYEGNQQIKSEIQSYADNAETYINNGISLILNGHFGTGKTMSLILLLKDLIHQGYSAYCTTFSGMIEMFTAGWTSPEDKKLFQERITMSQVLLLDDLGKEMKTKTNLAESTFDFLLRTRVQNGRPTFITTNMTKDDLTRGYGHAVMSLLSENALMYNVSGEDYRPTARSRTLREIRAGETRPIV